MFFRQGNIATVARGSGSMLPSDMFNHRYLQSAYRKGFRNGGWRRLSLEDKGLFRCALWVAEVRGRLANMRLMVQVAGILMKLLATFKAQITRVGRATAERIMASLQKSGVEKYAPQVLEWFKDRKFITYLGVLATNDPRM